MSVNHSARSGDIIEISFSIFFNMKVCCVFSIESPHRDDFNDYTQYTIFNIKTTITLNYPKSEARFFFSKNLKVEFKTAVVNEPTVFEPLKLYCNMHDSEWHKVQC